MAELVVRSQSKSSIRQVSEASLNLIFPLWGVISPLAVAGCAIAAISEWQRHSPEGIGKMLALLLVCLGFSILCLMYRRMLANDILIVDKEGIKLPRFVGASVNVLNYIPWEQVHTIKGVANQQNPQDSKVVIYRKRGRPATLSAKHFDPQVIEQCVLAAKMWKPALCDASLDDLQNTLRIGQRQEAQASYTELWEEELSRRFCPTAYIALEPGKTLHNNSLKVVSHLASGGLSALYLCQHENKKLVVLKEAVIPDETAASVKEKARELFEREAHLLMKLDHPTIVHVLDRFTEADRNYLLLEYINGPDLRQLVKQNGPQQESDVLEWALQIANGLKYLHERESPIIHRDLTPDNIVVKSDGQVVIVDFGAANEFIGNATGTFVGKHSYIAPEQFRGKASIHSDIYAFGCTLFYLLTGQEPEALAPSHVKEFNPSVSEELSELIESCTQLEASDRYQSVAQMIPVLRRLAAQTVVV